MNAETLDRQMMHRALALAARGRGLVEPNPLVGCVIAQHDAIVGEGWHEAFGGPHAEVHALRAAGQRAAGATLYVTLEPCCHHGKTPPCTVAVLNSGVKRVVIATEDVYPEVAGRGIQQLRDAGLLVEVGLLRDEATWINAPFEKRIRTGLPWVIAKWAMTLDGKLATSRGDSRWISSDASRRWVHELRGRVDAVMVGSGTAHLDDPLLTARPPGPRRATRVIVDSRATLPLESQLVRTARETPLLVVVGPAADPQHVEALTRQGCEILTCTCSQHADRAVEMLQRFGERKWTNVLVEGGAGLLGLLWDARMIDEVHAFIAPKVWGGRQALSPIGGRGCDQVEDGVILSRVHVEASDTDVHVSGYVDRQAPMCGRSAS